MFILTSKIEIGNYTFRSISEVEIVKSVEDMTDTAVIKMPSKFKIKENGEEKLVEEAIKVGDKVSITLGYERVYEGVEFVGYVTSIGSKIPLEIKCEDATWLLRGKKRKYKEGQAEQTIDDLVFVYCDTIAKLQPKVAILENVAGIIAGRAKGYSIEIVKRLNSAGYDVQIFSLNSATMGVPQSRERVFFIARRKDLGLKPIKLDFNIPAPTFGQIADIGEKTGKAKPLWPSIQVRLPFVEYGDQNMKFADAKYRNLKTFNAFFSTNILYDHEVPGTLTSSGTSLYWNEKRGLNDTELRRMQSFPADYDFNGYDVRYICGMSVPPQMIKCIATEIKRQWFK